jgi:hypothetical protein
MAQSETAQLATAPLPPPPQVPDVEATRRALADTLLQRRSLYSLAAATGAKTAEALAISTDDHTLAPIASAISAALAVAPRAAKAEEMGFVVEEATLAACRKSLTSDVPPPDLPAALEERGGAALRLLPSLIGDLERARSLAELESTIVALNARLLQDPSPTIRARAARWLGPRISLEGYSPLAPSRERRAAVEKIKARLAEAASPQTPREHEASGTGR